MCDACEKDVYSINSRGISTKLGEDVGSIRIYTLLINKSEDEKDICPSVGCEITYKGETVYKSRQHINYCPFCGRKLES